MKKRLLTALAVGLCIAANTFAQVPSYVPSNGLVGWWPFNGNANDESGNGNNGTVNGATLAADRFGTTNKAFSFVQGNNINIQNSLSIDNLSLASINLWFKTNTTTSSQLFKKGNSQSASTAEQISIQLNMYSTGTNGFATKYNSNCIQGNGWFNCTNNTVTLSNNLWHMLTAVIDNDSLKYFIDGVLVSATLAPNVNMDICNGGGISLGKNWNNDPDYYTGIMDDVGLWNRALTPQEITLLYQGCTVTASISPQSNTTFCQGGSVTLQANTGTGYTYEWYKNGVLISGASQSSYNATTSGNYTVKVIDGSCNATSSAVTVTVNTNPTVSLASIGAFTNYYAAPVTLTGSPSGGTYSGAGVSGNTFNPQQAGLGATSINYSYTNASNCSGSASTSTIVYDTLGNVCTTYDTLTITVYDTIYTTVTDTLIINTTLSLAPPNDQNTILIYPNPTSDHITIDNGNYAAMAGYELRIENNAGQQVFQSAINQAQFYLDLSTWTGNGLYFVHLIDPSGATVTVRKIVLQ